MNEKRIQAAAVRELCGGISDMSLWRWLEYRNFPKPVHIPPCQRSCPPLYFSSISQVGGIGQ